MNGIHQKMHRCGMRLSRSMGVALSAITCSGMAMILSGMYMQPALAQDDVLKPEAQSVVDAFDMTPVIGEFAKPIAFAFFIWTGQTEGDPVQIAIKEIMGRLNELDSRLQRLEKKIPYELMRIQNQSRLDRLRDYSRNIRALALEIGSPPTSRAQRKVLVDKAAILADAFSDENEFGRFWEWSAVAADDRILSADFSPAPGLIVYTAALNALIAALEVYSEGDSSLVQAYGPALRRQAQFMETLPIKTSERISCDFGNIRFAPEATAGGNVMCSAEPQCYDQISKGWQKAADVTAPGTTGSINASCSAVFQMNETLRSALSDAKTSIETQYGVTSMQEWTAFLNRYAETGVLRQFVGTFDTTTTYSARYLYGVKPNGDLLWYMHRTGTRKVESRSSTRQSDELNRSRVVVARASEGQKSNTRAAAIREIPRLSSTERITADSVSKEALLPQVAAKDKLEITHFLDGPKSVGAGWADFKQVFSGGNGIVYAITQEGKLLWYRHIDFGVGARAWEGPKEVDSGWGDFKQVFSSGDGIVYAIRQDGKLLWYRQIDSANGVKALDGPKEVGSEWNQFKQVFSGGNGIVYAVTQDGKLLWYKQIDFANGAKAWEGPRVVGSGWQDFERVFSPGEGVIYAMKPSGELLWYLHDGYKDGSLAWQGPALVAADWKDFSFVFSDMTGTWTPPVVR